MHRSSAIYAKAVVQSCALSEDMNFLVKTCCVFDVSVQKPVRQFSHRLVKFRRSSCPISARSGSVRSCGRISSQQAVGGIDALLDGLISVFRCRKNSCHPPRQDSVDAPSMASIQDDFKSSVFLLFGPTLCPLILKGSESRLTSLGWKTQHPGRATHLF